MLAKQRRANEQPTEMEGDRVAAKSFLMKGAEGRTREGREKRESKWLTGRKGRRQEDRRGREKKNQKKFRLREEGKGEEVRETERERERGREAVVVPLSLMASLGSV